MASNNFTDKNPTVSNTENSGGKIEPWEEYLAQNEAAKPVTKTRVDPNDGMVYEWNEEVQGWFPRINDDFIAQHHATYGFTEDLKPIQVSLKPENLVSDIVKRKFTKPEKPSKNDTPKKVKKEPEWFEVDKGKNAHVYVSGLPLDITEEEIIDMMTKFGIIMEDPDNNKLKLKLYHDSDGKPKGDALCCYLKPESVDLAINILTGTVLRGHTITAENAVFQLKGDYNPKLKVRKTKKKKSQTQEKLLDWHERDTYKKQAHQRAVVIHNLFDPIDFFEDPGSIIDYKKELKEECEKFGDVKKVFVFDRNPEGVCSVLFREEEAAQACVNAMDGRLCAGQTLTAHIWDGVTKYEKDETEEEKATRIKKWHDYIEKKEEEQE